MFFIFIFYSFFVFGGDSINRIYLTGVVSSVSNIMFDYYNKCRAYIIIYVRDIENSQELHVLIDNEKILAFALKNITIGKPVIIEGYINSHKLFDGDKYLYIVAKSISVYVIKPFLI